MFVSDTVGNNIENGEISRRTMARHCTYCNARKFTGDDLIKDKNVEVEGELLGMREDNRTTPKAHFKVLPR